MFLYAAQILEAEKYFKKGLEIDNKHLHILNNLGNLKRETYNIEESIEYYKKVLNIQNDAVLHFSTSLVFIELLIKKRIQNNIVKKF